MKQDNTEQFFFVQKILDDSSRNNIRYFLIKWEGYPDQQNTWEPQNHLRPYTVQQYFKNKEKNISQNPQIETMNKQVSLKFQKRQKKKQKLKNKKQKQKKKDKQYKIRLNQNLQQKKLKLRSDLDKQSCFNSQNQSQSSSEKIYNCIKDQQENIKMVLRKEIAPGKFQKRQICRQDYISGKDLVQQRQNSQKQQYQISYKCKVKRIKKLIKFYKKEVKIYQKLLRNYIKAFNQSKNI